MADIQKLEKELTDKLHGRILTPDGLRVVRAGLDNDPEKIGKHAGDAGQVQE
jgi:hypothetical protein